jgi:hypothetical protein
MNSFLRFKLLAVCSTFCATGQDKREHQSKANCQEWSAIKANHGAVSRLNQLCGIWVVSKGAASPSFVFGI